MKEKWAEKKGVPKIKTVRVTRSVRGASVEKKKKT